MTLLTNKDLSGSDIVNSLIETFNSSKDCTHYIDEHLELLRKALEVKTKKEDVVNIRLIMGILNNCALILKLREERLEKEKQEELQERENKNARQNERSKDACKRT